jgi:hypothetical protein
MTPDAFRLTTEWATVRYFWALDGDPLGLTTPARQLRFHHRAASSEHLGIALGLEVAYRYLKSSEPTASVRFVDGDFALDLARIATLSGDVSITKVAYNTPDYFAVVTKGVKAKIWAIEVKGTHQHGHHVRQLADAARQVTGVSVDGTIPDSLAFATVLLGPGGRIGMYALDPRGSTEWIPVARAEDRWRVPEWDERSQSVQVSDAPVFAGRLIDTEVRQLIAYATGERAPSVAGASDPPTTREFDDAAYVGRSVIFDDGRARIELFRGVEQTTWRAITSRDMDERIEARATSERFFTRETIREDRQITSFGEDGTILHLSVLPASEDSQALSEPHSEE